MKILFVGAHFPRPNNPTNGVWALLQVQALANAGHEVVVISPVPAIPTWVSNLLKRGTSAICPPHHRWDNVDAHYVRWPVYPVGPMARRVRERPGLFVPPAYARAAGRFRRIARGFRPDVIFGHHGLLGGYVAARLAREMQVPFFVTEHNFTDVESLARNPRRRRYYREMTRGIGAWVAVADRMRNDMRAVYPDVPNVTVHNGADALPDRLRGVPRPPDLEDRIVVLCVCFLYRRKNVPLLMRAFDSICAAHPKALLVVIGDGEDRAGVDAAAAQARNPAQLQVHGGKPHAEVLQYMMWCDLFANVGTAEPFGTVFTEAMMAGKPILYPADGGITDLVTSGVHGLAVTPGDLPGTAAALDQLLADGEARQRMGAAGLALSETLTWTGNAARMAKIFAGERG